MSAKHAKASEQAARNQAWTQTADLLVEALVPALVARPDVPWAKGLSLTDSDAIRAAWLRKFDAAGNAEDGPEKDIAVFWGGTEELFDILDMILPRLDAELAVALIGDGMVRLRAETTAAKLAVLFGHFGTLDVYSLDGSGGASLFRDVKFDGWVELTIVGEPWLAAYRAALEA